MQAIFLVFFPAELSTHRYAIFIAKYMQVVVLFFKCLHKPCNLLCMHMRIA